MRNFEHHYGFEKSTKVAYAAVGDRQIRQKDKNYMLISYMMTVPENFEH